MTTASIKTKLHKLIDENDDPEFLRSLMNVVKDANSKKDSNDEITPELIRSLDEAADDIRKNGGIPHEVVMKRMRKWLSK